MTLHPPLCLEMKHLPLTLYLPFILFIEDKWYFFLVSWSVCGETDPELPPHPGQLSGAPVPDHRGPDQLSPTVHNGAKPGVLLYFVKGQGQRLFILDTGASPLTCLPCCSETSTTHACPSAAFQSTCPTAHCWTSTSSYMLTSPPTSLKYATQAHCPDKPAFLPSVTRFPLRSAC